MTTARVVPVTTEMDGDELDAEDAWQLSRRIGLRRLLLDSFARLGPLAAELGIELGDAYDELIERDYASREGWVPDSPIPDEPNESFPDIEPRESVAARGLGALEMIRDTRLPLDGPDAHHLGHGGHRSGVRGRAGMQRKRRSLRSVHRTPLSLHVPVRWWMRWAPSGACGGIRACRITSPPHWTRCARPEPTKPSSPP